MALTAMVSGAERRDTLDDEVPWLIVHMESGKITEGSPAAGRIFGYTAVELIGMTVEQLVHPDIRDAHLAWRTAFAVKPEQRQMGSGLPLKGIRREGETVWVTIGLYGGKEGSFVNNSPSRVLFARGYVLAMIAELPPLPVTAV